MPFVFFGKTSSAKTASPRSFETEAGILEPVSPCDVRVTVRQNYINYFYQIATMFLGHIIVVLSHPIHSYLRATSTGNVYIADENPVPFHPQPGFAFCLEKGQTMAEINVPILETLGFRSISFGKSTVWLKDESNRYDFVEVMKHVHNISETAKVPDRYLNPVGFKTFLRISNLTSLICKLFHRISVKGDIPDVDGISKDCELAGWRDIDDDTDADTHIWDEANLDATISKAYRSDSGYDEFWCKVVRVTGGTSGISRSNGMAFRNPFNTEPAGLLSAGYPSSITSHGLIFKYDLRLSQPDTFTVGDVISRYFLTCLGESYEDQSILLDEIRAGMTAMRILPIGHVFNHIYRCLDIAIRCHSGLVPFFSNRRYEGCVLMGGPGASVTINGIRQEFLTHSELQSEFGQSSSHAKAIIAISKYFPLPSEQTIVASRTSMVQLRSDLLKLRCTSTQKEEILQYAVELDFGFQNWSLSANNLKNALDIITGTSKLKDDTPISRLCLFSSDLVMLGLSCFGDRSAPSWDIPNGKRLSLQGENPPAVPASIGKKDQPGSDADWVMPVRLTELPAACDEFRRVVGKGQYRSISTVLAKSQGMRVFSRQQMASFWRELRSAVTMVNPDIKFGEAEIIGKRKATDSQLSDQPARKRKEVGF